MNADEVAVISGAADAGPGQAAEALAAIVRELLPARESAAELATAITGMRSTGERQVQAVSENTDAVSQNTSTRAPGPSTIATVADRAGGFFSSAFGIAPLLSGLISLFGGGAEPDPAVLPYVTRPDPIRIEGVYSSVPRVSDEPGFPGAAAPGQTDTAPERVAPQVTINIQAMDSRSFLDHSDDIARAVRNAMLHSNSLNDVVNEL